MNPIFVEAIGFAASGLPDWPTTGAVLRGETPYVAADLTPYQPQSLPANERRRMMPAVREAFRVCEEAMRRSTRKPADLATVFASSEGDMSILHRINLALAEPVRVISPTDFHNSVHNAAAGYWTIAVGARRVSTTLCAWDGGVAAALIESATLLLDEEAVLMVAYDVPPPGCLWPKRPIVCPGSLALVLAREAGPQTLAALTLEPDRGAAAQTTMPQPELEALRVGSPSLRALPLLRALARDEGGEVHLESTGGGTLKVGLAPRPAAHA